MMAHVMITISFRFKDLKFMTPFYSDSLGLESLLMFNVGELLRFLQLMLILFSSFLGQVPLELDLMNTVISLTVLPLETSDLLFSLAYLMLQPLYIIVGFSCPFLSHVSPLVGLLHTSVCLVLHPLNFLVHVKHFCSHVCVVITIVISLRVSRNFFLIVVVESL